jgi:hypothetical protein
MVKREHGNMTGLKGLDRIGADPRVEVVYRDSDGIWVDLKKGFCSDPDTHGYHENTVREIQRAFAPGRCPAGCSCSTWKD